MYEQPSPDDSLRLKILVIDDQPLVLQAVVRLLANFRVTAVSGAFAGLELLLSNSNYDCIVCDVAMPELTGPALYARILELRPELAGRFVFMSGDIGGAHELICQELGSAALDRQILLQKPFSTPELEDAVRCVSNGSSGTFLLAREARLPRVKHAAGG